MGICICIHALYSLQKTLAKADWAETRQAALEGDLKRASDALTRRLANKEKSMKTSEQTRYSSTLRHCTLGDEFLRRLLVHRMKLAHLNEMVKEADGRAGAEEEEAAKIESKIAVMRDRIDKLKAKMAENDKK